MTDPAESSWLLAGLLQSGAAITAIVGGLLGSRYVAEHGNQSAAEYEVNRAKRDERGAELYFKHTERSRDRLRDTQFFLDDTILTAIAAGNFPERALRRDLSEGNEAHAKTLKDREQFARHLMRDAERVRQDLSTAVDVSEPAEPWRDVDRRLRHVGGSISRRARSEIAMYVYREMVSRRSNDSEEHVRHFSALEEEMIETLDRRQERIGEHRPSQMERVRAARSTLSQATETREESEAVLQHMRDGQGFRLGLTVLAVMALSTMGPAAAMLVSTQKYFAWPWLLLVVLVFGLGLFLLFRFMLAYSKYLSGQVQELPGSVWTLLPFAWKRWLASDAVAKPPETVPGSGVTARRSGTTGLPPRPQGPASRQEGNVRTRSHD